MKKNLLFIMLLSLTAIPAMAGGENLAAARQQAGRFLAERMAASRGVQQSSIPQMELVQQSCGCYVFNTTDGNGWAVVSESKENHPVLAYSLEGCYRPEEGNGPIHSLLKMYGQSDTTVGVDEGLQDIAPLLATKWGECSPYNKLMPVFTSMGGDNSIQASTGAAVTAIAQVLNYYQWPVEVEAVQHDSLGWLPPATIDWPLMQETYQEGDNTANAWEVAKLMEYIGHAVNATYTPDATVVWSNRITASLRDYFGYEPAYSNFYFYDKNKNAWNYDAGDLLNGELQESRPVLLFIALSDYTTVLVADGYQRGGFYHLNWGLNGLYNGYYTLPDGIRNGENDDADKYAAIAMCTVRKPDADDSTMLAEDELAVEDIQNSGCLSQTRGEVSEPVPTLVLQREGNVLSVQLLNYESNCATADFIVESKISGGNDGVPCSVNISVAPYFPDGEAANCICPYNVSFTVHDVKANSFYLNCWWFEGLVELADGEPLVLEDVWEYVSIGAQKYQLRKGLGKALLADGTELEGEVHIPSELNYEGKVYTVTSISEMAFFKNKNLTKVFIPRTIINTDFSNNIDFYFTPFYGCTALESIEVEEGNPAICSIDGVLFNREKTRLIAYPAAAQQTSYIVPESVTSVGELAFSNSQNLKTLDLPESVCHLGSGAFEGCHLNTLYIRGIIEIEWMWMGSSIFRNMGTDTELYVLPSEVEKYKAIYQGPVYPLPEQTFDDVPYRPMVEDGKVWKVGDVSGNPVKRIEYFYFDGDTIIAGRTCKQMMCQRYVSPEHPDYAIISQLPSLSYVGAWYEENKKVYEYNTTVEQFKLMYDFSVDDNATLQIHGQSYVIGPRQTGGIKGFKGVYRDVMMLWHEEQSIYNTTWLEGVGGIDGPIVSVYLGEEGHALFLMSCTVGDEVIYFNDEYEDGATPEEARKRFDFTHTIKTKPQAPRREPSQGDESQLYGEYNNLQLGINLDPLNDAYQVSITDDTGKTVYEKTVNAGSIVGLNIDISTYAAGRYTVVVENSQESFTGEFETLTAGIEEKSLTPALSQGEGVIYNLQGQRISSLQKGLNIVNGQKVYVK